MRDSIRLGRIRGIPVGVHWSLLVFAAFGVWNLALGYFPYADPGVGTFAALVAAIIGVLGLFGSIMAHEFGHGLVAQRRGVEVDGITLWMLGGVARLRHEPRNASDAAAIAAAGPAVSVGLGAALALATWGLWVAGAAGVVLALVGYLAFLNVALALFNLIPALPLDGGRLYQAWLWHRHGDRHGATVKAAGVGRLMGWGLALLGLTRVLTGDPGGFWLVLLGGFVASLAGTERRRARAQQRLARVERAWFEAPPDNNGIIDVRWERVE
ncbi:MAG: site-2 protease family protein [Acidimicrobiales bacterium]